MRQRKKEEKMVKEYEPFNKESGLLSLFEMKQQCDSI